ncbi:MAG: hypothetical protein COS39_03875 [Hydrogenophilales bacterium CG03_land_8_20_14_0_80_62_28]|nr:DUF2802 domain-containing protein [Betaproteobacteria bacterium]OIO76999.1 MAG: hypothetical protein AUJ86_10130 [Hydrogenophilaceae bacterium CG1_02_62_390]PIV23559.1 MAG: hypothetical protein COS39_03875 [Hydrogenophilales bacterium CG03_land_8_20_14_0_80_62_28]PIW39174.1 MAG: hypothetical protein COW23_02785 [Hydrogenophilales bacterium CG15_BIG_FIL_POST_REV_8_21_14_020_62_31]PIW70957.1 MAG: hypothetical protein COW07_10730 [Hydrogenophilales bacterium CG12_big_fil_rev_8_21_14_0_65_61_21]
MALTITGPELLIAVILATAIYLLETVILPHRRRRGPQPAADTDLKNTVHKLRAEVITLQHRIEELEVRLGAEAPEAEISHSAYDYAIQYARQGMIAPEIAARCGISQDEAILIVALHRKGQTV